MLEKNQIYNWDCLDLLKKIDNNSIDLCITDPPYNYEFLNHNWNQEEINRRIEKVQNSKTLIKHIPYWSWLSWWVRNERWYKKNYENNISYTDWASKWWEELYNSMKHWWYVLIFNSSRTIAHIQVAMEKVWFYTRDILVWKKNSWLPKWLNYSKKLEKLWVKDFHKYEWFHSCLRNEWEAILMIQKPLLNNYQNTIKETWLWLLKTDLEKWKFQWNVFENYKRDKKDEFNSHCTVKPIELLEKLMQICIPIEKNRVVLDPFIWSWSTAVACKNLWLDFIWFEINKEYYNISLERLKSI